MHELCDFIGERQFDKIMTIFLNKYHDIPVNIEIFCNEYITSVDIRQKDELSLFFKKWLYSIDEYKKYLQ